MKQCLADVSVLLPLLVRHHEHHRPARRWFDELRAGEALVCRFIWSETPVWPPSPLPQPCG